MDVKNGGVSPPAFVGAEATWPWSPINPALCFPNCRAQRSSPGADAWCRSVSFGVIRCLMTGSCLAPERHAGQWPQAARARCSGRQTRSRSSHLWFASPRNQLSRANSPSPFRSYQISGPRYTDIRQPDWKQARTLASSES